MSLPEGVQLAVMWLAGAITAIGAAMIVVGVRRSRRRSREPIFLAEAELPFTGPHSGVLADFASMLNEVEAIDDETYERLLWELRHVMHRRARLGDYTRQQLEAVQERLR